MNDQIVNAFVRNAVHYQNHQDFVENNTIHLIYVTSDEGRGIHDVESYVQNFMKSEHLANDIPMFSHTILVYGGDDVGPAEKPTVGNLMIELCRVIRAYPLYFGKLTVVAAQLEELALSSPLLREDHPLQPVHVIALPRESHGANQRAGTDYRGGAVGTTRYVYDLTLALKVSYPCLFIVPGGVYTAQEVMFFTKEFRSSCLRRYELPERGMVEPLSESLVRESILMISYHREYMKRGPITPELIDKVSTHGPGLCML